ncbi:uncharacterized protein LOC133301705 [Gastrolobium bilobum]|uniref:uncharacterized protein LOC133301705 n=1 Tax=Gastrolobium bilobum TaxID=150636 RepID=UPI002AB135DB|nr:uncharacterized protein LOC133301705 [Gastrolobium bilobum]
MFSKYDFLKDVNPVKEDWRIKVKLVRAWKVPNFQRRDFDDNVEMVLLDEHGGRIHATVKDSLPVRKKIHEGDEFDFVDYDIVEKETSDSPYLVNVIGLSSGIREACDRVVSGRKTKMVVLELDNLRGHKLESTLWEHYMDEVQSFLANSDTPHNVLIVQLGRKKCFRGKVGITNTKYTTRIVTDSKVPEIVKFKKCCLLSPPILRETEKKSISDVKLYGEVTTCITYGTIKAIESKYNWWYKSCKKCPFSVCEDFEKWYCKNCQKHWEDYYPRFSVQVRVVDNTDSAAFLLFDRDCVSLLGMSAGELRELHFKRCADLDQFPEELNVLNEKSMLFKINVKQKDLNSYSEPKYQDEANFDNACENEVVSSEPKKAADVESQTCDSADVGDISLTMLSPVINSQDSIAGEFKFSAVRTAKRIKLEKEFDAEADENTP